MELHGTAGHIRRYNSESTTVDGLMCLQLKNFSCAFRFILQFGLKLACRQFCLLLYPKQRASNLELRLRAAAIRNHHQPPSFGGGLTQYAQQSRSFARMWQSRGSKPWGAAGRGRAGNRSRSGGFKPFA